MSRCYAYIRVSTAKQAEQGVSLQEQRAAIERHAKANGIEIVEWFEECITAAKQGRPLFTTMLKRLRHREAQGVVIHKIDRSARNLRDWAEIGEMVDAGVQVHFANENMDLKSRGGRLSADIQAVVAADYIRNLREEILKGICGRLNEGITPFCAPLGYQNLGKGRVKEIDPTTGPLVKEAFELYAGGSFGLHSLLAELTKRGLRNRKGNPISLNGLSEILRNPFYLGLIRIKKTGETYPGRHEPLVSVRLFKAAGARLSQRTPTRVRVHDFTLRGLFLCTGCHHYLVGEMQKGHVYYRCQTKGCPTRTFREEVLEQVLLRAWPPFVRTKDHKERMEKAIARAMESEDLQGKALVVNAHAELARANKRHERLVDAYLDGVMDKVSFDTRKNSLLLEMKNLEACLVSVDSNSEAVRCFLEEVLDAASVAQESYAAGSLAMRRTLVLKLTSNRTVIGKEIAVEPYLPLQRLQERTPFISGAPGCSGTRTLDTVAKQLWGWAKDEMRRGTGPWADVMREKSNSTRSHTRRSNPAHHKAA